MGQAKASLLVLFAAAIAAVSLHPGIRLGLKDVPSRARGAAGEVLLQIAERIAQAELSPQWVERLCQAADELGPDENRSRSFLIRLKTSYDESHLRSMDQDLAAGDYYAERGQWDVARDLYQGVLHWGLAFSTRTTACRVRRARIGLARLPPAPGEPP